jgi:hypothetical protein
VSPAGSFGLAVAEDVETRSNTRLAPTVKIFFTKVQSKVV